MWWVDVAKIRTAGDRFDHVYQAEAFAAGGQPFVVSGPVTLGLDIQKDQDRFRLVGGVQAQLSLTCSRCLEPFAMPVDAPIDLRYEPRRTELAERETEVGAEDFSTAYYDDHQIDLEQLLLEQFHLAVPMKPLCGEACRGLCAQCGVNLNRETCECVQAWDDPRLSALQGLAGSMGSGRRSRHDH